MSSADHEFTEERVGDGGGKTATVVLALTLIPFGCSNWSPTRVSVDDKLVYRTSEPKSFLLDS